MTDRLERRAPEPGDEQHYRELTESPEIDAWLRPPPLEPFGPGDAAAWLEADVAHWEEYGFGPWLVFRDGGFVGRAGLRWTQVEGVPEVELAWAVLPRWWGRGFATEAALAGVALARERGIDRLIAMTLPTNAASRRVMEKIGMRFYGDIVHAGLPHVVYELPLVGALTNAR
jgi:[ribosomal protein S5]-alanine N-acetyltransferase